MEGIQEYPFSELASVEMTTDTIDAVEELRRSDVINMMIEYLPAEITLEYDETIEEIRDLYDSFLEDYGQAEVDLYIHDITKLENAEAVIADLKYEELHKLENAEISDIDDLTYNGEYQEPEITVTIGRNTLVRDTDYTISYSDNKNKGTATVTVTGKGEYSGSKSKTFNIKAKPITPSITLSSEADSYIYDGEPKTPAITVRDISLILSENDFDVEYTDNINAGTATVTVTCKGNYEGSSSRNFTIKPIEREIEITLDHNEFTYNGSEQKPAVTVMSDGEELSADAYDLKYSEGCINAGTYTVQATLNGNYSGEDEAEFEIKPKEAVPVITLSQTIFYYDGEVKTPEITSVKADGVVLDETDYDIDYDGDRIEVGTYKVTVTLKGNYTGQNEASFEIMDTIDPEKEQAIEEAGQEIQRANELNSSDYTDESYAAVTAAKTALEDLINDRNSTADQIAQAKKDLTDAINALQKTPAKAREEAVEEAGTVLTEVEAIKNDTGKYTAASFKNLTDAIAALKVVLKIQGATAEDINQAVQAVKDAKANLVVVTKPVIKVGSTVKVSGSKYLVTSKTTVALKKAKNVKSFTVPATVKLSDGKTYKVTRIDAKALTAVKIRTVTIGKNIKTMKKYAFKSSKSTKMIVKTKLLKKSTIKGSLKGSKIKTVQVKIGTKKVNRTYVNKYKKIFTKKIAGKKVRVK